MSFDMQHPDQPPGIDPDDPEDYTRPSVASAALRVLKFVSEWGDGLICSYALAPLYSRDLEVLATYAEEHSNR